MRWLVVLLLGLMRPDLVVYEVRSGRAGHELSRDFPRCKFIQPASFFVNQHNLQLSAQSGVSKPRVTP